jgi:hypothetical protein
VGIKFGLTLVKLLERSKHKFLLDSASHMAVSLRPFILVT